MLRFYYGEKLFSLFCCSVYYFAPPITVTWISWEWSKTLYLVELSFYFILYVLYYEL